MANAIFSNKALWSGSFPVGSLYNILRANVSIPASSTYDITSYPDGAGQLQLVDVVMDTDNFSIAIATGDFTWWFGPIASRVDKWMPPVGLFVPNVWSIMQHTAGGLTHVIFVPQDFVFYKSLTITAKNEDASAAHTLQYALVRYRVAEQ